MHKTGTGCNIYHLVVSLRKAVLMRKKNHTILIIMNFPSSSHSILILEFKYAIEKLTENITCSTLFVKHLLTSWFLCLPNPPIKNRKRKKSDGFCIKKACIPLTLSPISCISFWYVHLTYKQDPRDVTTLPL